MINRFLDASRLILAFRFFHRKYCSIIKACLAFYRDSNFFLYKERLFRKINICFQNSYLMSAIRINDEYVASVYAGSMSIQRIIKSLEICKTRLTYSVNSSKLIKNINLIKKEIYASNGKALSATMVIAFITNMLLSLIFKKNMHLAIGLFYGPFFLLAVLHLFSGMHWREVQENSVFLKSVNFILK